MIHPILQSPNEPSLSGPANLSSFKLDHAGPDQEGLDHEGNEHIAELLDQYACRLELGDESGAEQLLDAHPELVGSWGKHLESLQALCRVTRENDPNPNRKKSEDSVDASILGDYRLNREIGRGGMGVVYEATQLSLRRSVALKVLPFAAVLDKQQVARFRNEAQAAASLHHPHIVPVFAVGCERGVHYYSMQLIDGRTLDQVFQELTPNRNAQEFVPGNFNESFTPNEQTTLDAPKLAFKFALRRPKFDRSEPGPDHLGNDHLGNDHLGNGHAVNDHVRNDSTHGTLGGNASTVQTIRSRSYIEDTTESMICVAEALDFAHQQGVVHRDVKPSNLLIDSSGKIWVADFGLARIRGVGNLTAEGKVMGTARYMSPEQIAGRPQEIDHRTDIYSLGITLYELLTLRPAFSAPNREALFNIIEISEPIAPRRLNPAVPIDLETIVLKAIAKRKDDRYATAGEMAEDMRRFLEGKPTLARRPTPVERAFKWAVRRQRLVCGSLCLVLLAVLGLGVATMLVTHESRLKDEATARAHLHLDQAHALVDRFGGLMTQRLADFEDGEGLRTEILREAERYYLDFLQYADQDSSLRGELAKVQYRLAATCNRLGDFEAAEVKYQSAISSFESLRDQSALTSESQADLALCFHNLAALQKDRGRYSDAIRNYKRAVEIQQPLLAEIDRSPRYLQEWAMTQNNFGLLLWQSSETDQAESRLRETQSRLVSFLTDSPSNLAARQQLVECRNSLVAILLDKSTDEAESLIKQNIAELESSSDLVDLTNGDSWNSLVEGTGQSLACQLAISQNNLATVLGRKGDRKQGIRVARDAIKTLNELMQTRRPDPAMQEQLAIANNNLGQLLWSETGEKDAAVEAFLKAEKSLRNLASRNGQRPESLSRLAGVLHNLGMVHHGQGSASAAIDDLTEAMELQAQAVKQVPFHQGYRQYLEKHRELLDHVLSQFNDARNSISHGTQIAVAAASQTVGQPAFDDEK